MRNSLLVFLHPLVDCFYLLTGFTRGVNSLSLICGGCYSDDSFKVFYITLLFGDVVSFIRRFNLFYSIY